jgi:hypothetical protein
VLPAAVVDMVLAVLLLLRSLVVVSREADEARPRAQDDAAKVATIAAAVGRLTAWLDRTEANALLLLLLLLIPPLAPLAADRLRCRVAKTAKRRHPSDMIPENEWREGTSSYLLCC